MHDCLHIGENSCHVVWLPRVCIYKLWSFPRLYLNYNTIEARKGGRGLGTTVPPQKPTKNKPAKPALQKGVEGDLPALLKSS